MLDLYQNDLELAEKFSCITIEQSKLKIKIIECIPGKQFCENVRISEMCTYISMISV